jgi:hypothetical protein
MILVISDNEDKSTNDVLDRLSYYNKSFLRINGDDVFKLNDFIINNETKEQ